MRVSDVMALPVNLRAVVRSRLRSPRRTSPPTVDFEAKLKFQIVALGLPAPVEQLQFASGRKFAADFAWPDFRLLVEVQGGIWRRGGGAHSHPNNLLRDIEKLQRALLNGWAMFPVTTDQVKSGEAVRLIELALKSKGWKP